MIGSLIITPLASLVTPAMVSHALYEIEPIKCNQSGSDSIAAFAGS
jgi:hypothetical protein